MMQLSSQGLNLIERHEGFAAFPYLCPAKKLTIGFGHVIRPGESFPNGISRRQAEAILASDVAKACAAIERLIIVPLAQTQFDALVSFTFNLGTGALQRSALRQRLNRGDYAGAADEFSRWVFGGGRKLPGLIRRRADERTLFLSAIPKDGYQPLPWAKAS